MELLYTFLPFLIGLENINTLIYFIFKIPRYNRLTQMDEVVNTYIDYYGEKLNAIEEYEIIKRSAIIQFLIQTTNMCHLLTCC